MRCSGALGHTAANLTALRLLPEACLPAQAPLQKGAQGQCGPRAASELFEH